MQSFLSELYANASGPLISAILLGLLTAIAPCPMTINITAIGYIGRDFSNKKRLFLNGIFYAMGTIFAYSALAMILYFGADKFRISSLFQQYSEKIIGPLLLVIGVLMLGIVNIKFPAFNRLTEKFRARQHFRKWDAFLLGGILALAFCPYSGILYFGILVPLTISASAPWLPVFYSSAAAIPVIIFAWLLAFTVSGIGKLYNKIKAIEFWFSKCVALLFIGIGIYYIFTTWV
jgi:cytochrome c-type biogenesis protein